LNKNVEIKLSAHDAFQEQRPPGYKLRLFHTMETRVK